MADFRVREVLPSLADTFSLANYMRDQMVDYASDLGKGDSVQIGGISALTVSTSGDATSGNTVNTVASDSLTLAADSDPAIFAWIPGLDSAQNLRGNWGVELGKSAAIQLRNQIDEDLADYLAHTLAFSTSGAYHHNVEADALSEADVLRCIAQAQTNKGLGKLAWFVHPYGQAAITNLAGFFVLRNPQDSQLGLPMLGHLYGHPVFMSQAVPWKRSKTATAAALSSGTWTITLGAGHGFVPGELIYTTGFDSNISVSAPVAISSVTSTQIVFSSGSSTDADLLSGGGPGLVTSTTCENMLVDLGHVYTALQRVPTIRIKPVAGTSSDQMEVRAVWGRVGRVGRVQVLHTHYDQIG